MRQRPRIRSLAAFGLAALSGLLGLIVCALPSWSETAPESSSSRPVLTLNAAVQWALEHNPALNTFRKNRGIAQAGVVIGRQYPFNPIIQDFVWGDTNPPGAGVTNRVFNEHTSRLDIEWRRQGRYRRGMAHAILTRTEWEIAAQELLTSILATRAFNTLLYRQLKHRMLQEGEQLTEQVAGFTEQLVEEGTLRSPDRLLAHADVVEARNALGPARSVLVVAENDLHRALGMIGESFELDGTLEKSFPLPPAGPLIQAALERRPDVHALQFAVQEADARRRLEVANRFGNPSLGPAMEVNETSVAFVGLWAIWQLPVINIRRGEISQREAEQARALQALRQGEILVQQDVFASMGRLAQAEEVVNNFRTRVLPVLQTTLGEFDKLYAAKDPDVNLARVITVRRRLLTARDAYLDALFELSQAQADLAAAVADLSFVGCRAVPPTPESDTSAAPATNQQPANPPVGEQLPPPAPLPDK